jgi:hypothetical protein
MSELGSILGEFLTREELAAERRAGLIRPLARINIPYTDLSLTARRKACR